MGVDAMNTRSAKTCIIGWFVGLAYYNWFAHSPQHVPLWAHALLVSVGMFAASIVIGGGLALVAATITKRTTGRWDGSADFFAWGVFIGPVLTFLAAGQALRLLAS